MRFASACVRVCTPVSGPSERDCSSALSSRVVAPDDDVVHVGGVDVEALGDLRLQSVVVQARQAAEVLARDRRSACL